LVGRENRSRGVRDGYVSECEEWLWNSWGLRRAGTRQIVLKSLCDEICLADIGSQRIRNNPLAEQLLRLLELRHIGPSHSLMMSSIFENNCRPKRNNI
jgi:hypothetical protein